MLRKSGASDADQNLNNGPYNYDNYLVLNQGIPMSTRAMNTLLGTSQNTQTGTNLHITIYTLTVNTRATENPDLN